MLQDLSCGSWDKVVLPHRTGFRQVRMGKELFYKQGELGIAAAYELAGQTMACNLMAADGQEGLTAFAEKRQPQWRHA